MSRKKKSLSERAAIAFDSVINVLSPSWAARRQLTRTAAARLEHAIGYSGRGHRGADNDRYRGEGWLATDLSDDAILEDDLDPLVRRCRDLYRNNNYAHAAVETRVSHEIGTGVLPQSKVREISRGGITVSKESARKINREIEAQITLWSDSGIDSRRRFTLQQIEKEMVRSLGVTGDAFLLLGMRRQRQNGLSHLMLTVDLIESERVSTPPEKAGDANCRLGIQYSSRNEIQGYWVQDSHPGDPDIEFSWTFIPRYDAAGQPRMLHVFDQLFPGQSRGVPWLTPAMARLKDLESYFEAELLSKQIEACFGLVFKQGEGSNLSPYEVASSAAAETTSDRKRLEDLYPGMIHYAAAGESVDVVDPNRPGANFQPFVEKALRSIAGALNIPYECLAKDYFRTTFSSGQLAMLDGRRAFRMRRQMLVEQALVPVYCRFVYELVLANEVFGLISAWDYLQEPSVFNRHAWTGAGFGFLNPRDEVSAAAEAISQDMMTLADHYAEQGSDVEEKLDQRYEEKMRQLEDEIAIRRRRWEMESEAGLPHQEAVPVTGSAAGGSRMNPTDDEEDDDDGEEEEDVEGDPEEQEAEA